MRFGTRKGRAPDDRARRGVGRRRFRADVLEDRTLLSAIDLVNIATAPYGVEFAGLNSNGAAGFSSADVGDVNGDGFDDFLIGAPTLNAQSGNFPTLGQGNNSSVYLVFGSNTVPNTTTNWLTLTADNRVADLGQLGNSNQNSPVTGNPTVPFSGVTFTLPGFQNSQVGASVAAAGDVNGDGFADFLIGAPGAADPNNPLNVAAGQAFLVYGGTNLTSLSNNVIDLGTSSTFGGVNIMTFTSATLNSRVGRGVAGIGDFIPDGNPDIAIGAPGSSISGLSQSGSVFVISGGFLRPARTQVVDLATVGQTGGVPGMIFTGERAGQGAGFSVAAAGDVDATSPASSDLLIGAPDTPTGVPGTANGPGSAYIVYGIAGLVNQGIVTNGFNAISLNRASDQNNSNPIAGARFVGTANGDLTGYSVASAGDFNGDGLADIVFGSPGYNGFAGRADMIFGLPSPVGPLLGTFTLDTPTANALGVQFFGFSAGDLAGFAVSGIGEINNDALPELIIGAPGANGASGLAYLLPGNADLFGPVSLDTNAVQGSPAFATVISVSQPVAGNFLGASVGGLPFGSGSVDADLIADFVIGAPGYALSQARAGAGAGFILEGAFVPLQTPVTNVITSPIGVEKVRGPFVINATTPADLPIFILSGGSNTPGFDPAADIDPTTITVNGVPLPNPGSFQDVGDLDGDGIDDAEFIFSPRSLLGLTTASTSLTVAARTLAASPFPNRRYQGTASITVTQGGGGGGNFPSVPATFGPAFENLNAAAPRFGERLVPSLQVIGRPQWKPLPPALAYRQFLPANAFGARERNWAHPGFIPASHHARARTFDNSVFSRGRFPKGVHFGAVNHRGPTIGGPLVGPYGYFHGRGARG
jgi:hypothetical protein